MNNIFYFKKINKIGGTEQFLYEIAKKYHNYDIAIMYDEADGEQLARLKKYFKCIKHKEGEKVTCKRAFFNFNIDAIDDVESTENYYCFISHANYEELGYKPPIENPKLNHFVGVSKFAARKLDEYGKKLGREIKTTPCYDPLTLEPPEKVMIIVSACRLDDEVKGGKRTVEMIKALDRYCDAHGTHYLWLIFTNHTDFELPSRHAIYMEPRVNVRPYIAMADWVVQVSNDMETFCYTTNEAWSYGVPCVTTPLSVCKELPVSDNERIILDWDCANVDEVAKKMFEKNVKPFKYTPPEPHWERLLAKGRNTYKAHPEKKIKLKCTYFLGIDLMEEGFHIEEGKTVDVSEERAEELLETGYFEKVDKGTKH